MKSITAFLLCFVSVISAAAETVFPGLLQYYFRVPTGNQEPSVRYEKNLTDEDVSSGVRALGVAAADSESDKFVNAVDDLEYGWNDYGVYAYEGEIYVEAGVTYTFCAAFDDGAAVWIDGVKVVENNNGWNSYGVLGTYTPEETGWKAFRGFVWDFAGGKAKSTNVMCGLQWTASTDASAINNTGLRKDASLWKPIMDSGDGSFLRVVLPDEEPRLVWYVDAVDGDDAQDGSVEAPKKTLGGAIAVVGDGDEIRLGSGVHVLEAEEVLLGKRGVSIVGVGAGETVLEPAEGATIRHMTLDGCRDITISGITFRGGNPLFEGEMTNNAAGGSMILKDSVKIRIEGCDFIENGVRTIGKGAEGGALYVDNSNLVVVGCRFEKNEARCCDGNAAGGAIAQKNRPDANKEMVVRDSVFRMNRVGHNGSVGSGMKAYCPAILAGWGTSASPCKLTISNCLFALNDSFVRPGDREVGKGVIGADPNTWGGDTTQIVVEKSTFAYNLVFPLVSLCKGTVSVSESVICGHRSIRAETEWNLQVKFANTLYDTDYAYSLGRGTVEGSCVKAKPVFRADMTLAETSLGYAEGWGYRSEAVVPVARTLVVNPAAAAGGTGTQVAPFDSLTAALESARNGDTIELAAGTYSSAKEAFPICVEGLCNVTIVGAGSGKTIFEPGEALGASCMVVTNVGGLTLGGFTIRGFESTEDAVTPSALKVDTGAFVTVSDVEVTECVKRPEVAGTLYGGVVGVDHLMGVLLDRVRVRDCMTHLPAGSTLYGGVVSLGPALGVAQNCDFTRNAAAAPSINGLSLMIGAAEVDSKAFTWTLRNCLVADNTRVANPGYGITRRGDVAYLKGSYKNTKPQFQNCTLIGGDEGASQCFTCGGPWDPGCGFVARNTLFGNVGTGVYTGYAATALYNCIVTTNSAYPSMSMGMGSSYSSYEGIAQPNPAEAQVTYLSLAEVGFRNVSAGDYRLNSKSPAVDAGMMLHWMTAEMADPDHVDWFAYEAPLFDLNGEKRVVRSTAEAATPDVGCYEFFLQGTMLLFR